MPAFLWAFSGTVFFIFVFSIWIGDEILLMLEFELWIAGVRSDSLSNWATATILIWTTPPQCLMFFFRSTRFGLTLISPSWSQSFCSRTFFDTSRSSSLKERNILFLLCLTSGLNLMRHYWAAWRSGQHSQGFNFRSLVWTLKGWVNIYLAAC